jgi:hypothetical protein
MSKGSGGGGGAKGHGGVAGRSARAGADGSVAGAGAEFAALKEGKFNVFSESSEEAEHAAMERSKAYAAGISQEQRDAIKHYSGGVGFMAIRDADAGRSTNPEAVARAQAINAAIARAPKHEQTVYRGIAVDRATLQAIMKQKEIRLEAVSSASRTPWMARKFVSDNIERNGLSERRKPYGVVFKIKQKSGAPVEAIAHNASEQEILLPKGARYRITGLTRTSIVAWQGRSPTLVVHAEEI